MTQRNEHYDIVIIGGRVMDPESGLDAVRNVGIKGGKIDIITEQPIQGKEVIDAAGHVVAPGFIDGHMHTVDIPLAQKGALLDGVTTAMDLEAGAMPVGRWYDDLEGRSQTNYGASVSSGGARTATFDKDYLKNTVSANIVYDMMSKDDAGVTADTWGRIPGKEGIENIMNLVEQGLREGGLGVGICPGYMVDGMTSQEMIGVQKLAGKFGRFSHLHGRFSSQMIPTSAILGFQEAIASTGAYGGGLIIAHFTAQALNLTETAIEYIGDLRKAGMPVVLEVYPYNYGEAGNGVSADYLKPDNYQKNMGRSYNDIMIAATGERLTRERYDELLKTDPYASVMFYNATEEDNLKAVAHPDVLIGSDSFPFVDDGGNFVSDWDTPWEHVHTHPRTNGTHGCVLRLTREKNLMPLMTAISKMSYQYAKFLQENGVAQMANKGRIKAGADADITIFNPETVRDNSSLKKGMNAAPTTGIPYVVVNGTIVVKDAEVVKDVYPGKPVRCERIKE